MPKKMNPCRIAGPVCRAVCCRFSTGQIQVKYKYSCIAGKKKVFYNNQITIISEPLVGKGRKMSRIAVIIDNFFEDSEYTEPVKAFQEKGHDIVHVGIEKGKIVKGKKKQTPVEVEQSVDQAKADEFDALLIPGGYSPDQLRVHPQAVAFARHFMEKDKPVFSICHGPQLLISADAIRNRTVTGWTSIIQDIKNAGATFVDQSVVTDGNLVTSRNPSDLPDFISEALKKLD
jgi:protease I